MVTYQIRKRIICVYQHFFILMQTEEQQQEGYFNNWVSKNIFMSAICQPFVLKNSLHLLGAEGEDCILNPVISFSSEYWVHYAENSSWHVDSDYFRLDDKLEHFICG